MAKFICIENNKVTSILDYLPNAPDTVQVFEISDEDSEKIKTDYYYFDIKSKKVLAINDDKLKQIAKRGENFKNQNYLSSTDWKIMRHIREQALGLETSLTNKEYLELENKRQEAAKSINI